MAQHDYVIDNGSGATVRADINSLAQAIQSCNLGASAPSVLTAGMLWADTGTSTLWIRNQANTAWIAILSGTWT